eukprot:g18439.t1
MYQISADDIGCKIVVEARLADLNHHQYRGVAVGEIGPFELDISTRRSLDNSIGAGGSRFPVTFYKGEGGVGKQNYMLHVSAEEIKVIQPGMTERFDREISIAYTGEYPRVLIHPLDTLKFKLLIDNNTEMHFGSLSRQSRDLIALTIRCFHARRHIGTAALLDRVFANPGNHGGGSLHPGGGIESVLDLCLYTDRLRGELIRQLETRTAIEKQYNKISTEKTFLDDQLHDTITSFTGMIQDLQDQVQTSAGAPGAASSSSKNSGQHILGSLENLQNKKLENLQNENANLKIEVEEQRRQLLQEKHRNKLANPFGSGGGETIYGARGERTQLMSRLQQADREKAELSSNFVYVKSEYDKMQMRNGGAASSSSGAGAALFGSGGFAGSDGDGGGDSAAFRALQEEASRLKEERSRLAARVEQLTQDAEKSKTTQDQGMERVLTSNARLLEEKDRLVREVERVSRLYAEAVAGSSLSSQGQGQGQGGGYGSEGELQKQVRNLQLEALAKDERIRGLEAENATLKNRIRKLASV